MPEVVAQDFAKNKKGQKLQESIAQLKIEIDKSHEEPRQITGEAEINAEVEAILRARVWNILTVKLLNEQLKSVQKFELAETKQFEQVVLAEIDSKKDDQEAKQAKLELLFYAVGLAGHKEFEAAQEHAQNFNRALAKQYPLIQDSQFLL
jgi:hypothetical protein